MTSAAMDAAATEGRWLLACDFDWSVIDEDSDHYVFARLAPDLLDKLNKLSAAGKHQWTDLVDELLGELHGRGIQPDELAAALHSIPFNSAMKEAMDAIVSCGHEIIIVSDANTFYISEITKVKQINTNITSVITNSGTFDASGRLRVTRHTIDPPHGCSRCAVNLCKGKELLAYTQSNGSFTRILYLGDGRNDFCPSTKLKQTDLVLVRNGRPLADMMCNPSHRANVAAQVEFWDTADDVLRIIRQELSYKN